MSDWILYADPVQIPVQRLAQMEDMMARLGLSIVGCSPGCLHVCDPKGALSDRKKGDDRRQVIRSRVGILTEKWQSFKKRMEDDKKEKLKEQENSIRPGDREGQVADNADAGLHAQGG